MQHRLRMVLPEDRPEGVGDVCALAHRPHSPPSDSPAALRPYAPHDRPPPGRYSSGAFMAWHRDDALFTEPQVEVVFTVTNRSDSVTQWRDVEGTVQEVECVAAPRRTSAGLSGGRAGVPSEDPRGRGLRCTRMGPKGLLRGGIFLQWRCYFFMSWME